LKEGSVFKPPTIEELTDFTFESYGKLLKYLLQIYRIVPLCEVPRKNGFHLILRHDIDYCPNTALKMAKIEKNLSVRSTYFVLLSTEFYNMHDKENLRSLEEISALGHEIGLHYYPWQYRQLGRNLKKTLENEILQLEALLGKKVYSIAQHGPWDRDPFAANRKYINANHPFIRGDLFIDDSFRSWTPISGFLELLTNPPRKVQLLIHPDTWQEDKIDRKQFLERLFKHKEKEVIKLKERTKEHWLNNYVVMKHDRLIASKDFPQCSNENNATGQKLSNLNYYSYWASWFLINTSLGWNLLRELRKIRNNLTD
jgi:hypothetical protein